MADDYFVPSFGAAMLPEDGLYPLSAKPPSVPGRRLTFHSEELAWAALEMLALLVEGDCDRLAYAAPPKFVLGEGWVLRYAGLTTEGPE